MTLAVTHELKLYGVPKLAVNQSSPDGYIRVALQGDASHHTYQLGAS
jgi:hypothetical protein